MALLTPVLKSGFGAVERIKAEITHFQQKSNANKKGAGPWGSTPFCFGPILQFFSKEKSPKVNRLPPSPVVHPRQPFLETEQNKLLPNGLIEIRTNWFSPFALRQQGLGPPQFAHTIQHLLNNTASLTSISLTIHILREDCQESGIFSLAKCPIIC